MNLPDIGDIRTAAERIRPHAHRTPVLTCAHLNERFGAKLFFKCENFQRTGAFKFRGACNAVFSLPDDEAARGVATHSSGNHAQAMARAAKLRGIKAYVVMPRGASAVKREATAGYGAEITECEPTQESRETTAAKVIAETGAMLIHPYNDPRIIAGQGTAALELLDDAPGLDAILVPVGGGGLASGTAIAAAALSPGTRVIGVEPSAADDAQRSLEAGRIMPSDNPRTIADGLCGSLGELTLAALRAHAHSIVTVSEEGIVRAMRLIWERMKIVIEPSAAVTVAALMEHKIDGQRIGVILSGGNVDLDRLPW